MPGLYQRKDRLYQEAKRQGFRSRASFKLEELDKKYRLFKQGMKVLDLGCAPGGWLQVVSSKVGKNGLLIGVDIEPTSGFSVEEIGANAAMPQLIAGDVNDAQVQDRIMQLSGGFVDVILSDMSPNISGVAFADAVRSAELVETAFAIAEKLLRGGGAMVAKIFPGAEEQQLYQKLKKRFTQLSRVYLDSTRKTSKELYFVGKNFIR